MKFSSLVQINPDRLNIHDYSNSKKFMKVTQKLIKANVPYANYEKISKRDITSRDIYTAKAGDVLLCLMNTKKRIISIVEQFCIIPNTFVVLRPISISSNTLYGLLKMPGSEKQLTTTKNSITLKEVQNLMLPYEISPAHNNVLHSLSKSFQHALLERLPFQEIIDNTIDGLKYSMNIPLEDLITIYEVNKLSDDQSLGKKNLHSENIMLNEFESDSATLLITRIIKNLDDLKVGILCESTDNISVNQNLIKADVSTDLLIDIGMDKEKLSNVNLAKYLAYYFLSTKGKKQLMSCIEKSDNRKFETLKISALKLLNIPIALNPGYLVEEIERHIHWQDAERFSNQFDFSEVLFKIFNDIVNELSNSNTLNFMIPKSQFTLREFGLLLAQYFVGLPAFDDLEISVVLESFVHYGVFVQNRAQDFEHFPLEFYSPHDQIDGDVIIVLQQFEQKLRLPEKANIIYLRER